MLVTTQQPVRLATTSGAVTWVYPGEPRSLEGEWLRMALEAGCVPGGGGAVGAPPAPAPTAPTSPLDKVEAIQGAIRELIRLNRAEAFTSAGVPRVKDVSAVLGYDVNRVEVEAAFGLMSSGGGNS